MRAGLFRMVAVGTALALAAVACGGDASEPVRSIETDFELVIGSVLPEGDSPSEPDSPSIASVNLAIQDIKSAGGNVRLLRGDSGSDPDVASETVNRLLGEGAHVIVGASASEVSQGFIQTLHDAQIPQCSPANTSPSFSTQENAAYYFRTVPPDEAVSSLVAAMVAEDGAATVAIPTRNDDWGVSLSNLLVKDLGDLGVAAEIISYEVGETSFDPVVAAVLGMGADAVVFATFSEGYDIIRGLIEAGMPAARMYGTDGIYDHNLAALVNPSSPEVLNGLVVAAAGGTPGFSRRLMGYTDGNVIYGGQAYDCVIVLMLAALAAGTTNGPDIIAQVPGVTKGGQKCFLYEECALLAVNGVDFDYVGMSGPLELDEVGDPTFGRFFVAKLNYGILTVVASHDVSLADLD